MLAVRQAFISISHRTARRLSTSADAVVAVALLLGAALAIGRATFLIG
jgi:hypothetical protein